MIITLVSLKGGVGKTTSAIHIAAYLSKQGRTLLLDNDPSGYALGYDRNSGGERLPFDVLPMAAAMNKIAGYQHVVIDTEARPSDDDIANYADGCDLLVVPTTPAAMPLEGLGLLVQKLGAKKSMWRTLLTIVPPYPSKQGEETRKILEDAGIPIFRTDIPRAAAFDHASKSGVPVYDLGPRGQEVWQTYAEIGGEIDALVD